MKTSGFTYYQERESQDYFRLLCLRRAMPIMPPPASLVSLAVLQEPPRRLNAETMRVAWDAVERARADSRPPTDAFGTWWERACRAIVESFWALGYATDEFTWESLWHQVDGVSPLHELDEIGEAGA